MVTATYSMPKSINYPFLISLLIGLCSIIIGLTEVQRIQPELQEIYQFLKISYGIVLLGVGFYFYYFPLSDLSATVLMVLSVSYSLLFMWFAPLYEVAYLEIGLACSFLNIKRAWIFPSIFGAGLVGMILSLIWQYDNKWYIPPILLSDSIWICAQCFLISLFVQKFAIGTFQKDKDRMVRFSIVGEETSKLMHDLKGMLSSPLLLLEALKNKNQNTSQENYEKQIQDLTQELENMRSVVRSINQLVITNEKLGPVDLAESAKQAKRILDRRLKNIKVQLPESKYVHGNEERIQSVLFNLMINSIEAFESSRPEMAEIKMHWSGNTLIYSDNAGGFSKSLQQNKLKSGLGLELIKIDLSKMGAKLKMMTIKNNAQTEITFKK